MNKIMKKAQIGQPPGKLSQLDLFDSIILAMVIFRKSRFQTPQVIRNCEKSVFIKIFGLLGRMDENYPMYPLLSEQGKHARRRRQSMNISKIILKN